MANMKHFFTDMCDETSLVVKRRVPARSQQPPKRDSEWSTGMIPDRILSADSHIVEPADFWIRHIDRTFRERAPHAHTDKDGTVHFIVDKNRPLGSVGAPSQAGVRFEDASKVTFEGAWADVRPGCADPHPRRRDMEKDGIAGEVIFPTLGARLYGVVGGELLSACFRAGNDWLMERFCQADPRAFKPVALLNIEDIPGAVAELERCAKGGMRGAMIPTYPGEAYPYHDPRYDPLWAAAQALSMPVNFHIASTCPGPGQLSIFTSEWRNPGAAAYSSTQDYWVRRSVADMIFAGVFERFPKLKAAIVEHELAWAIYFLRKMDETYRELSQTAPYRFKNGALPSDFFRHQIFLTFQEDKVGLHVLKDMIGTDTMMFGSDYPHAESTWPNSRKFLEGMLKDFSAEERRKLVSGNVAKLFDFDSDDNATPARAR